MTDPDTDDRLGRREFLQRGALTGLGMLPLRASAQTGGRSEPRVQRYATLGRTGLRVSDVSFGGSRLGLGEGDGGPTRARPRHQLLRHRGQPPRR